MAINTYCRQGKGTHENAWCVITLDIDDRVIYYSALRQSKYEDEFSFTLGILLLIPSILFKSYINGLEKIDGYFLAFGDTILLR